MAAKTIKRTARRPAVKARISSKRPSVSSKMALSLRNLRTRQRKTQESLNKRAAKQLAEVRLNPRRAWLVSDSMAEIQLRLSKLEFLYRRQLYEPNKNHLIPAEILNWPTRWPVSPIV